METSEATDEIKPGLRRQPSELMPPKVATIYIWKRHGELIKALDKQLGRPGCREEGCASHAVRKKMPRMI